jgi:FMN phosphatase YigB (HAD superfamily)/DNA-binding Xre family transcriptional regulator
MAMDEVGLGKSLQRARQAAGITQQELCQRASLSYSTLAKIERGAIKSPSIFTIQRISQALGVDLNQLVGVVTNQPPTTNKQRSKTGVRFVYFDINGCLLRFFHKAFTKLSVETGVGAEAIEAAFWHYNDVVCRGEMTMEQFNKDFSDKINVPNIDWMPYYLDAVEPILEMQELVKWASENYYVGLLSNIMPGFIDALKERQLIPNITYDAIIDSSQVGAVKPEAKIYEVAQAKSGVAPQEILLVDDSRANLMAAEKMGWHVLWFDDYEPQESVPRIKLALEIESTQPVQPQPIEQPQPAPEYVVATNDL